jgi:acid phosphatase
MDYSNQETHANDYVRKHNPLVLYDSVVSDSSRARSIKSFVDFDNDLKNKKLPQWAFITPNMTNDAHDTNITFAAKWERPWMANLLKNEYFMNNTVVLLTFDEDQHYEHDNRVFSVLVGGAIPEHLQGTVDDTFYTHYSSIATVSANWGLPSLGRWDCGANIFDIVANKTGYVNYHVDKTYLTLNQTYPGPMSIGDTENGPTSKFLAEWPVPLTKGDCSAGHGILDIVKKTYGNLTATYNYTSPYPWDSKHDYNVKVTATRKTGNASTSNEKNVTSSPTAHTGTGVAVTIPSLTLVLGALLAVYCLF